jgi:hypothetical protein
MEWWDSSWQYFRQYMPGSPATPAAPWIGVTVDVTKVGLLRCVAIAADRLS